MELPTYTVAGVIVEFDVAFATFNDVEVRTAFAVELPTYNEDEPNIELAPTKNEVLFIDAMPAVTWIAVEFAAKYCPQDPVSPVAAELNPIKPPEPALIPVGKIPADVVEFAYKPNAPADA